MSRTVSHRACDPADLHHRLQRDARVEGHGRRAERRAARFPCRLSARKASSCSLADQGPARPVEARERHEVAPQRSRRSGEDRERRDQHGAAYRAEEGRADPAGRSGLPRVFADGERLGQVLLNLAENAVKFTPPGGSVSLEAKLVHGSGAARDATRHGPARHQAQRGRVRVADTGIGIPESERARVFDAPTRWTGARLGEQGGTGLGLSIGKRTWSRPTMGTSPSRAINRRVRCSWCGCRSGTPARVSARGASIDLGGLERERIALIARLLAPKKKSRDVVLGIGDDAAIVRGRAPGVDGGQRRRGRALRPRLARSEGRSATAPLRRAVSDLAAMGARPLGAVSNPRLTETLHEA